MSKRNPEVLLADILNAMEKISRYTTGIDHAEFLIDDKTIDAVARNIGIIGEVASQLPDDFKNANPGIPWSQVKGMRNRIIHDYFGLDLEILWEVIQHDLPDLESRVREITATLPE